MTISVPTNKKASLVLEMLSGLVNRFFPEVVRKLNFKTEVIGYTLFLILLNRKIAESKITGVRLLPFYPNKTLNQQKSLQTDH